MCSMSTTSRWRATPLREWVAVVLLSSTCTSACARVGAGEQLAAGPFYLSASATPEWSHFAGRPRHGSRLDLTFQGRANLAEQTLLLRQEDVKGFWDVAVNGRVIGELHRQEVSTVATFAVPPGALRDGDNLLSVRPREAPDDVVMSGLLLDPRPMARAIHEADLEVRVRDQDGRQVPARITIVDDRGFLAPLAASRPVVVRPGVAYTATGHARLSLRSGAYTVYAGRGFEYGVAEQRLTLAQGEHRSVDLTIRREVDTSGLVACDTHVHTRTLSGHGDATDEERAITLAGEGIELAIATEHNRHASYAAVASRAGVQSFFTSVPGVEVTTTTGHFNAFPVGLDASPMLTFPSIRAVPDVFVILNHPRDRHSGFVPFAPPNFERMAGLGVDAIELVNSGALRSRWSEVYQDWFALLDRGAHVAGVGASDSHDVNRSIVGQARTYVPCPDADPGRIDVSEAMRGFREGRVFVSLGLLTRLAVVEVGSQVEATITVDGPSWTSVDYIALHADGRVVHEERFAPRSGKLRRTWRLPRPDRYLVAVATGPGVRAPYWPSPRPYQPTERTFSPYVIGSSNPIWMR